ncbi:CHASE domain-containing protein [Paraglaciecola aquimarina]|uniref:CHASE domain-containing protein n=1 Tax=Paraglaciecola aquimarina TaxID=1235557 RepID=A0ABU3STJ6_9ALTE|nr:CHASE domain-containing protein [Paraglaciecola aquimarina]MDU0353327.1 CHASE domain-containing protein [Paraglaciecola aquimarina]
MPTKSKNTVSNKSIYYSILVLLIGILCSSNIYRTALSNEKADTVNKLQQHAATNAKDIETEFRRSFFQVSAVANLFASSTWVTNAEFVAFINRVFPDFPEGRRLTSIQRVPVDNANEFIAKIRENPGTEYSHFSIFNFTSTDQVIAPQAIDGLYSVISYTYPEIKNLNFIGKNISADSTIGSLIYPVMASEYPIVSNFSRPVKVIQDEPFVLHIYPILTTNPQNLVAQNVAGVIVSNQRIHSLFSNTLLNDEVEKFKYVISDQQNTHYYYPEKIDH